MIHPILGTEFSPIGWARRIFGLAVCVATIGCSGNTAPDRGGPAFSFSLTSAWQKPEKKNRIPVVDPVVGPWPPRVGASYPDLKLVDQNGQAFQLSRLTGKVILLELVAIPCKGCQAFAGGNRHGGFGGVSVQSGLDSIHDYAKRFAGVDIDGGTDIAFVQLLLYGTSMDSPSQQEVTGWARHFGMDRSRNQIVLRGEQSMISRETYQMIPGFHLIDRHFVLRYDSSGHHPKDDLYRDLLPALGRMVRN